MIERALDAGCILVSVLTERKHIEGQGREVIRRCGDIPVYTADFDVLAPASSNPLYRSSIRVSMGTVFQIPWTFLDAESGMEELRGMGFATVAMALREDSISVDSLQLVKQEKLAIVLGTEGDGIAPDAIARCEYTVRIPMAHGVDSLNVAASAVAFWQLGKRP